MSEEQRPKRRPQRHWKRARFRSQDTFLWAKDMLYANAPVKMGAVVDKDIVTRTKLLMLFKARLIVPQYVATPHKDPQAPPTYPAEDLASAAA